jgi:serine/threonine protein kinase
MGIVFLGEHQVTRQKVAIKMLQMRDPVWSSLIQLEFEVLAALDHPAVVEVHDYGITANEQPFYSMDYISGLGLDEAFTVDTFSNEDLAASLIQITDAVSYVHHKQLIHRDIKPKNILIDNEGLRPRARLVDFGLAGARFKSESQAHRLSMVKAGPLLQQTLFKDGMVAGTPRFMAPEQLLGRTDARSDIYALGVTVYVVLTGRYPINADSIMNAMRRSPNDAFQTKVSTKIVEPTMAVRQSREHSGPATAKLRMEARLTRGLTHRQQCILNASVLKALQSDPSLRHSDAAQFGQELSAAFGLSPKPVSFVGRFRSQILRSLRNWFHATLSETDPRMTRVLFITDRARVSDGSGSNQFGSDESDELTFGYSIVQLPEWHIIGRIRPRLRDRLLGRVGYEVIRNRILERREFESELGTANEHKDFLLFVHGYNTSFETAVLRAAQFQADLKMAGQVICFSWPSLGQPSGYGRDAALCEESEICFIDALRLLTSVCRHQNLHILAHSMGSRLLLEGCYAQAVSESAFSLGQVIIAAPDVSQRRFRQRCGAYAGARRRTLYASKHDHALMGSRFLHARGRAGYIPPLMIVDDVDTVDTSIHGVALWALNHSVFGDTRALVSDIATLIRQGLGPEFRVGLDRRVDPESGKVYWVCIP